MKWFELHQVPCHSKCSVVLSVPKNKAIKIIQWLKAFGALIMKTFEDIVQFKQNWIHFFSYRAGRVVEDAKSTPRNRILDYLDGAKNSVRLLFIDFSLLSVLSIITFQLMNLPVTTCVFALFCFGFFVFLTDRSQKVKLCNLLCNAIFCAFVLYVNPQNMTQIFFLFSIRRADDSHQCIAAQWWTIKLVFDELSD